MADQELIFFALLSAQKAQIGGLPILLLIFTSDDHLGWKSNVSYMEMLVPPKTVVGSENDPEIWQTKN